MERIQKIYSHPIWKQEMDQLTKIEQTRIFCCHGLEHLLDVARIAYIENLEQNKGYKKDVIYATALLHDIGKAKQYTEKIPHEQSGYEIAEKILKDCAYTEEEKRQILDAILGHRKKENKEDDTLSGMIYRADKKSRICCFCKAEAECNWSIEKKNMKITI